MAKLKTKIKLYAKANGVNSIDFTSDVKLQNDGSGDYIHTWSIDGLAKPTDEQLASYNSAATTEDNNNVIRSTRRNAYGDIGDQLDEIYSDIDTWKARIKKIKDDNPKG